MSAERETDRADILREVSALLRDQLALAAWGRLLIELAPGADGALRVSDVTVEEIVDEAAVDGAFGSEVAKVLVPGLADVVTALLVIDDVDVTLVGGGTFVHRGDRDPAEVAFLPGLVHAPSAAFDARREAIAAFTAALAETTEERLGTRRGASLSTDMVLGTFEAKKQDAVVARGQQVVLGSFARAQRSWVWGAHNPSLAEQARARCAALLDAAPERQCWELSTAGFTTDASTAWALAGWIAEVSRLVGLTRIETSDGFVVLGVRGWDDVAVA